MNIFYDYEDFFGKSEASYLSRNLCELFDLSGVIRRKLGKQGYLLDNYLCWLMEAASAKKLFVAAEAGFQSCRELRELCKSIMREESACAEHPLYEKAKEYIAVHPFSYQETHTSLSLYCMALSGDFLEYAADKYADTLKEAIRMVIDIVNIRDLYRQICVLLGHEDEMERLNLLFRQRFLSVAPMAGFIQGMTDDLLQELTSRDVETSKLTVQLWLDENTAAPGTEK